jgi:threonine synthase
MRAYTSSVDLEATQWNHQPMAELTINPNIKRLVCSLSGHEVPSHGFTKAIGLCLCCVEPGRPVVVEYDLEAVRQAIDETSPFDSDGLGIAAFEALLPVNGLPDHYAADVGHTPSYLHPALSEAHGVELFIKNEGTNPSGSFKDRGLSVAIALGRACGARRFCLPTQGNAGVAASLFSARLGLPGCLVYMPEGYQGNIYHREAAFFGAEVRFAGANIAAAGKQMREDLYRQLSSGEMVELSTFFEPGRLEGKKTMGLELATQFGPSDLPRHILYPTGGGTGLVGIWKAFQELSALGLLTDDRLPAMVAVQSANCAPVVQAFERGLDQVEPIESLGTVADGLDVPGAIMGHGILSTIRASGGTAVAVEEQEIKDAFAECGRLGVPVGYESAALLAALARLRESGFIGSGERVLLLLTASHLIPLGQPEG